MDTPGLNLAADKPVRDLDVVISCDDGYAMPLAVSVRSLLENLSPHTRARITVLDGGMRDESIRRCEDSWADAGSCPRPTIRWAKADVARLGDLPCKGYWTLATYFRFLIPDVLPESVDRALYVDPDTIVRTDLTRMADVDLEGRPLGGAQDAFNPFVVTPHALRDRPMVSTYLSRCDQIPNWRELGIAPESDYYNAGILSLDLGVWRREQLGPKLIEFSWRNEPHIRSADQYALNAMLAGRWKRLDPRWNQQPLVVALPWESASMYPAEEYRALRDDPYIVHFCGKSKPWHDYCDHKFQGEFLDYLGRTRYAGLAPKPLWQAPGKIARRSWWVLRKWFKSRVRETLRSLRGGAGRRQAA